MPQIYDMRPTALLPLRRKACWGFFRPKNPTASAGFEPANLGTKGQHATPRPPKHRNLSLQSVTHLLRYCLCEGLEVPKPQFVTSDVMFHVACPYLIHLLHFYWVSARFEVLRALLMTIQDLWNCQAMSNEQISYRNFGRRWCLQNWFSAIQHDAVSNKIYFCKLRHI